MAEHGNSKIDSPRMIYRRVSVAYQSGGYTIGEQERLVREMARRQGPQSGVGGAEPRTPSAGCTGMQEVPDACNA